MRPFLLAPLLLALAACGQSVGQPVERLVLDQTGAGDGTMPADSATAQWRPAGAQRIAFGETETAPWLSLACEQPAPHAAPRIRLIRHAPADPGAKALFAIAGNGRAVRLKVDAAQASGGWRWEGVLPTDDIRLDVLEGRGGIEATVPGGGTLRMKPSALPRDLLAECRRFLPQA